MFFSGIPVLKIDPDCSYVSVSFFELFFEGSVLGCHSVTKLESLPPFN